jgi:hypothetical protein
MKFLVVLITLFVYLLNADEYEIGHGLRLNDKINLGAYFSIDYTTGDEKKQFRLDDVAILAYGNIDSKLSYMAELEAAPLYVKNYTTDVETTDKKFHHERAYLDYISSDLLNIRIGKQITPIGYWNLEPINVLRDTSSSPLYSNQIFPKLLTGLDLYGYLDKNNTLKYHLFAQKNKDLDEDYINIKNENFFGFCLEYEASSEIGFGGAAGKYITTEDDKHVGFIQANAKYDNYPFKIQAEIAYSSIENKTIDEKSYQFAGYAQALYNLNMKHALVTRYEYFDNNELRKINHIGVFGYSYRPIYPVSFKAEYQWNSDSYQSKAIVSFSVLF